MYANFDYSVIYLFIIFIQDMLCKVYQLPNNTLSSPNGVNHLTLTFQLNIYRSKL